MTDEDVAITGVGLLTAFGRGVDVFWRGLLSGRTAIGPGARFDTAAHGGGEPVGEVPAPAAADAPSRKQAYLATALAEALDDAGLCELPPEALVVVVGQAPWDDAGAAVAGLVDCIGPPVPASPAAPDGAGTGGDVVFMTHACASAAFGMSMARDAVRAGLTDVAVVAGASVLNRFEYASMKVVRALSGTSARPFDLARDGITVGEGGGAVVLERADRMRARGHRAEVLLSGVTCRVAAGRSAASDEGVVADCLRSALDDAGNPPLDHVHAHATGTPQGDAAELAALETVAGERGLDDVPTSSHKGAVGHLLHASGLPAVAAARRALREGTVPPTTGLATPEPTRRIRLIRDRPVEAALRTVAVNSFGFGGNNATLVLRRT